MSKPKWYGLQTVTEREQALLAPYAMHSQDSAGRKHAEQEHPYRGLFQRDRDRVLHCSAYRRLADKTQVFTGAGDYHRTRLTHTLEVASISRTMGRALRLNEDLIEALAMLHDIGHPPFGHAGEDALSECLADVGGFSHNAYALTLVEELEVRHTAFPGLNLTREVLGGQTVRANKSDPSPRLLEVQVVDVADSITYDSHDTDDAIAMGLLTLEDLCETTLVCEALDRVHANHGSMDDQMLRKAVVHELIDWQVGEVLTRADKWLRDHQPCSASELHEANFWLGPEEELAAKKAELENFLYTRVYRHDMIIQERSSSQRQLQKMFSGYCHNSDLLPRKFQLRAEVVGIQRSVGDYLAGMTDRYCQRQYLEHFADGTGDELV